MCRERGLWPLMITRDCESDFKGKNRGEKKLILSFSCNVAGAAEQGLMVRQLAGAQHCLFPIR